MSVFAHSSLTGNACPSCGDDATAPSLKGPAVKTDNGELVAPLGYVDVHAHLIHEKFSGLEDVIAHKCRDAGNNSNSSVGWW